MRTTTRRAFARGSAIAATLLIGALLVPAVAGARVANFVAVPNPALVGQQVRFDASTSIGLGIHYVCPSGIDWYRWDFNSDGVTDATGQVVNHVFTTPGDHPVTLTVGVKLECLSHSVTKTQTILSRPGT